VWKARHRGGIDEIVRYFSSPFQGATATGPVFASSQIPLPSTWFMLLSGFVGLGFYAYRGSKKNVGAIAAA
jgi:hypothetical protein